MTIQYLGSIFAERLGEFIPKSKDNSEDAQRKSERVKRNIEIFMRYYGLDGNGGQSMEKTGKDYGLTRESVRQITDKIAAHLKMNKTPIDGLIKAIALIDSMVPASASFIESKLVKDDLIPDGFRVEGLINASQIFGIKSRAEKIITVNGVRFVVQERLSDFPKKALSLATKEISHNGAVNTSLLIKDVAGVSSKVKLHFIKEVINTVESATWINDKWVYFGNKGINRLVDRLKKIFAVNEKVHINEISKGIERNWNKNKRDRTSVLPKDVILNLISTLDGYTINASWVSAANREQPNYLSDMENEMFNLLKNSPACEMREKELEDTIVGNNPRKKYNFSQVLNYSPVIYKKERGLYGTLGVPL